MVGVVVLALAVALLMLHFAERSIPLSYALAAFVVAAVVAAGDLREPAGQVCTTTSTTATTTTTGPLGAVNTTTQTYPVETCVARYTLRFESLVALIVSVAFAMLTLAVYVFERLGRAAGGWSV